VKLPECPQRTTPGFSFSMVNRTLLEGIADRQFGKAEMAEVLRHFGMEEPRCAYCGASPATRWDHVVPVFKGGDTVLGNIVPACSRCDDSKRHLDYQEWATSAAPGSPLSRGVSDLDTRLDRIRRYMTAYRYTPKAPEQRLSAEQLDVLRRIKDDLDRLRCDITSFLDACRPIS
jgi:hypothetical protein